MADAATTQAALRSSSCWIPVYGAAGEEVARQDRGPHEWRLIEETYSFDTGYSHRWYCIFCRRIEKS